MTRFYSRVCNYTCFEFLNSSAHSHNATLLSWGDTSLYVRLPCIFTLSFKPSLIHAQEQAYTHTHTRIRTCTRTHARCAILLGLCVCAQTCLLACVQSSVLCVCVYTQVWSCSNLSAPRSLLPFVRTPGLAAKRHMKKVCCLVYMCVYSNIDTILKHV